jgi:hypothetical protein
VHKILCAIWKRPLITGDAPAGQTPAHSDRSQWCSPRQGSRRTVTLDNKNHFRDPLLADFFIFWPIGHWTQINQLIDKSINRLFPPKLIVNRLISKHVIKSSLSLFQASRCREIV